MNDEWSRRCKHHLYLTEVFVHTCSAVGANSKILTGRLWIFFLERFLWYVRSNLLAHP